MIKGSYKKLRLLLYIYNINSKFTIKLCNYKINMNMIIDKDNEFYSF